jgi:hypothetical protein
MAQKSKKDFNQLAKSIVDAATNTDTSPNTAVTPTKKKRATKTKKKQ